MFHVLAPGEYPERTLPFCCPALLPWAEKGNVLEPTGPTRVAHLQ